MSAQSLGLVLHHYRPEVLDMAGRALEWCDANGVEVSLPASDAELIDRADLATESDFADGLDLCLSLGGDGTMLRTTHLCASAGVPVLGINAGQLGYLTHVDPDDLESALDEWFAGRLATQDRMLLEVEFDGVDDIPVTLALNEVVLERADAGHTVAVVATIGGRRFTRYLADGLIVSTPTGSTAYSLSAGGPIVEPDFEALVVTPVAAHMVFDRSMVLAPTTEVRLTVDGYRAGVVTVDGRRVAELTPGQTVVCRAAQQRATFVVRNQPDFHTVLTEKFGLSER